jgi:Mg-chelatase subunit ChlD
MKLSRQQQSLRQHRTGGVLVLSVVFMVFVFGMLAFTTDLGFVSMSRVKLQAAVDAAVLAGIDNLTENAETAQASVDELLGLNGYDVADAELAVTTEYGTWDTDTRTFTVVEEFSLADALRVSVTDSGLPAFFGPVFNENGYVVQAEAIATLSSTVPRDIVMVIDCSTSMAASMSNGQTRMDNARAAAQSLIAELLDEDRVGLAVFSWTDPARNLYKKTGRPETDLSFDKAPTTNRVGQLVKGLYNNGTNVAGGLRAGLDVMLNDPNPRPATGPNDPIPEQIIVLLTDGQTNQEEPYPTPDDGPTGVLPPPPYANNPKPDKWIAVTKWANTIKARNIKLHVVTLGSSAYNTVYVEAASPNKGNDVYYHHVANGGADAESLLNVYKSIGRGNNGPRLVK